LYSDLDHLLDRKPWAALTPSDLGDVSISRALFDDVVRPSEANGGRISVMFGALKASDDRG
jgi:hypothetical protein